MRHGWCRCRCAVGFPRWGEGLSLPSCGPFERPSKRPALSLGLTELTWWPTPPAGWIARIYLGSVPYGGQVWQGREQVAALISLGSPHTSRERWTKRNLDFVNTHYPGAFWPEVKYVCVAGRVIQGQRLSLGSLWRQEHYLAWLAYNSYWLTAGQGELWGDGITPIEAAHLQGAVNLTLPNCYHSGRGGRRWYGSPEVVETWAQYLA
jgi:hypothetical protein